MYNVNVPINALKIKNIFILKNVCRMVRMLSSENNFLAYPEKITFHVLILCPFFTLSLGTVCQLSNCLILKPRLFRS